jgi:TPR repeat protein
MDFAERKRRAAGGSCVAQATLGIAYLYGDGAERDYSAALKWLSLAGEQGASRALFHLGRIFEEGWGIASDHVRAFEFYRRAAERGEFLAGVQLARMYRYGRGTEQQPDEALRWYKSALAASDRVAPCSELEEAAEYVRAKA